MMNEELLKLIIILAIAVISALTGNKVLLKNEMRRLLNSSPNDKILERLARLEERSEAMKTELQDIKRELEHIRDRLSD